MTSLGEEVRKLRQVSRYRDIKSFAAKADLSYEGLRKIEKGERLPNRETLSRILKTGKVPAEKAEELKRLRERAQAVRDDVELPVYATDESIKRLVKRQSTAVDKLLAGCDPPLELDDLGMKTLSECLEAVAREELSA